MTIKKAELHTHLEGTISPSLAKRLAQKNKIPFPSSIVNENNISYRFHDFLDFLKVYDLVASFIKNPEDYYEVVFEYLKSSAQYNTIYVEMMYSPMHAEKSSGCPSHAHLEAIQQAIQDAEEKFNIIGRIIVTAVRHFGSDAAIQVAEQAVTDNFPCIVGFGLGGDEINYPARLFKEAYQIVTQGGLKSTVHAGEFGSFHEILSAINELPVNRIGHGVNAIFSHETMQELKSRNIALEICPSSNIALGLFQDMSHHPLPHFIKAGMSVSLGSDDPPFFNTNLGMEYEKVQKAYGYTNAEMEIITKMAIEDSFADLKTKNKLLKQF